MLRRDVSIPMLAVAVAALGCQRAEEAPATPSAAEHAEHAEHAGHVASTTEAVPLPPVPEGAAVLFVAPKDGQTVEGPLSDGKVQVHVVMGVEGIEVEPAGEVHAGKGHHHIIVDGSPPPAGEAVPADATHIHYGGGQTEADVPLSPGEHTLTLQFADGMHRSYGPDLTATIHVDVVPAAEVVHTSAKAEE